MDMAGATVELPIADMDDDGTLEDGKTLELAETIVELPISEIVDDDGMLEDGKALELARTIVELSISENVDDNGMLEDGKSLELAGPIGVVLLKTSEEATSLEKTALDETAPLDDISELEAIPEIVDPASGVVMGVEIANTEGVIGPLELAGGIMELVKSIKLVDDSKGLADGGGTVLTGAVSSVGRFAAATPGADSVPVTLLRSSQLPFGSLGS